MRHLFLSLLVCMLAMPAHAQIDAYPDDPEIPAAPTAPAGGAVPLAPESPSLKPSKLWPADTVPVFMLSCTQLQKEIVSTCRCIIDNLIKTIPHDEFLALSEANLIERDKRYLSIRQRCLGSTQKR